MRIEVIVIYAIIKILHAAYVRGFYHYLTTRRRLNCSSLIIKVIFELIINYLLNYYIIELNYEHNYIYFEKKI